jgi:hypothetical protein
MMICLWTVLLFLCCPFPVCGPHFICLFVDFLQVVGTSLVPVLCGIKFTGQRDIACLVVHSGSERYLSSQLPSKGVLSTGS